MDENLGEVLDNIKLNNAIEWKNKGNDHYKQGNYEEALVCYNEALQVKPEYLDALNNKGLALVKLGRNEEAKKCYETIKKIKQNLKFTNEQNISNNDEIVKDYFSSMTLVNNHRDRGYRIFVTNYRLIGVNESEKEVNVSGIGLLGSLIGIYRSDKEILQNDVHKPIIKINGKDVNIDFEVSNSEINLIEIKKPSSKLFGPFFGYMNIQSINGSKNLINIDIMDDYRGVCALVQKNYPGKYKILE